MKRNIRNRLKLIKFLIFCFVFLIFIAFFMGLRNAGSTKAGKEAEDVLEEISSIIPREFSLSSKDYMIESSMALENERLETNDIEEGTISTPYVASKNSASSVLGRKQNLVDIPDNFSTAYTGSYGDSNANASSTGPLSQNNYTSALDRALQTIANTRKQQDSNANTQHVAQGRVSSLIVGSPVSQGNGGNSPKNFLSTMTDQLSNVSASLGSQSGGGGSLAYDGQNAQEQKKTFLNEQQKLSDYELKDEGGYFDEEKLFVISGSTIPIVLITAINSDLPGFISARVLEDVYDTFWGTEILIPKGTMVIGNYDSSVSWGQNRLLVTWQRLSRPDGYSIQLEGMQGIDKDGSSGAQGVTRTHIGKSIASSVLSSLFSVGSSYSVYNAEKVDDSGTFSRAIESTSRDVENNLERLSDKFLNRQPTIYIKPGTKSYIFVSKDIIMPAYTPRILK